MDLYLGIFILPQITRHTRPYYLISAVVLTKRPIIVKNYMTSKTRNFIFFHLSIIFLTSGFGMFNGKFVSKVFIIVCQCPVLLKSDCHSQGINM